MAASYRLDIASGASGYCTGWALPSFLGCRKTGADMDTATKRVKYAGDTSCLELLDGFNGKYATDGETIINTESRYIVRPRIRLYPRQSCVEIGARPPMESGPLKPCGFAMAGESVRR